MHILLIEDEKSVAAFVNEGLTELDYVVTVAHDGLEGERLATEQAFDLVLLDLMLPGKSGIDVCQSLRNLQPGLPILMLTALGTSADKLAGFDAGADDYLVKPFEFSELVARIKALTRRAQQPFQHQHRMLRVGPLELDLDKKVAIRDGRTITLTAKEFALLEYLMVHQGKVLSRAQIAADVWDIHFDTGTNVVDVYVNFVRKKIDKDFDKKLLHTQIGLGYMMDA
jgi:DNA-binding response OmpR family regulator